MRKQLTRTLVEVGSDEKLIVLIGDIGHYLLSEFEKKYKNRFYNMGIAEQSMMSIASGLALHGFFPVVFSIAPFITERCYEQIKIGLCYQEIGVNIVSVGSAFDYASLGCTHHCYEDIAILRALPNMQVIYPSSPHEFDILFKQAYNNGRPTYFRLPVRTHSIDIHPVFGEVERICRGDAVTVVAIGPQVQNALEAIKTLQERNIYCDLIYVTTIKPMSPLAKSTIRESVAGSGRLITVEEHSVIGGIGDVTAMICVGEKFDHVRLGIPDEFLTNYGTYEEHCKANNLTRDGIYEAICKMLVSSND